MRRALLLSAACVAALTGWIALAPSVLLSNVSYVLGAGAGCAMAAVGARRATGATRRAWAAIAVTEGLWASANVYWLWYESVRGETVPSPGPFDVLYLAAAGVLLGGVGALIRPALRGASGTRLVLDGLLVASSLFFVAWSLVLSGLPEIHGMEQAITWAYPVVDVAIVCLGLLALGTAGREGRTCWVLLSTGMIVLAVSDSVWAYANLQGSFESGGSAIDAAWFAGYLLLGLAALTGGGGDRGESAVPERWTVVVPFVPFAVVLVVFALTDPRPGDTVRATAGIVAVALLFVRQLAAMLENQRLARSLERRVGERTAELSRSESLFRAVTQTISDAVVVLDERFLVRYVSPGLERISGYRPHDVEGRGVVRMIHPDDRQESVALAVQVAAAPGSTERLRCRVRVADGTYGAAEITMANLLDHPEIKGHLLAIRDLREQHALEERLRHRAEHDVLTGLANRAAFVEAAATSFARGETPALVLLDLDGFKEVNDSLGHAVGDDLLVEVAVRLQRVVGPDDVIARLGGDEFAVLVRGSTPATAIAERLDRALVRPFVLGGRSIQCGASIGVTTVGGAADELLRNADLAMYTAKDRAKRRSADAGRHGTIQLFHDGMHRRMLRRLHLEQALRGAVARDELSLVFQPVVDVVTGAVLGGEALLRWHTDEGEVEPSEFIPIAEETGLIGSLGRWVLERACEAAASWDAPVGVAVNASVRQLVDGDLVGDVEAVLRRSGLDPARLTIELTETAVMDHSERVLARLRALKHLGVRLSIDDFGTGYSSLGRLRFLPVDEVKIDRAFISSGDSPGDDSMAVVEAVLAIAERLGLEVVAEGVEHLDQLVALRDRGCRRAQGYLLSRPQPGDEFARLAGTVIDTGILTLGLA